MSLRQQAALAIGTLFVLTAGCIPAALQPPSARASVSIALSHQVKVHKPRMQRGIDVDWYAYRREDVTSQAAAAIAYVKSLHANGISITFPFFMHGPRSSQVRATSSTPTPAQLSTLVHDARRAGMTVSLRPLLANGSLGRSRTGWKPVHEAAWFRSYRRFLRPYLVMAQRDGVAEFIEGTEFAVFDTAPGWRSLSRWARTVYHKKLACAANWNSRPKRICGGVTETVDAYPPVRHGTLLAGWERYDRKLRRGTVITEIGIAAAPKAPTDPSRYGWPIRHTDPKMQARWFTAACHAAPREHLGGIYYWSIGMGKQSPGPTLHDQQAWADSAGAHAIASCFAAIERANR